MKIKLLILFMFLCVFLQGQDTIVMTLNDVMKIAEDKSLDAFRAKNMYLSGYWDFRAYKAGLKPNLYLNLTPISYTRALTKRYDYDQNIDIYRQQRSIESYGNLTLTQNIPLTGGDFFISSGLSRLTNIGNPSNTIFTSIPFQIGFNQPIFGYNSFKWNKKLAPLQYEIAKKQYIQNLQNIKLSAVDLYFNLILEYKRVIIARNNLKNAIKLYKIGKEKYKILAIKKEELLDLELNKFNSQIELTRQKQNLQKANLALNSFLNLKQNDVIKPVIPDLNDTLYIQAQKAIDFAKSNNPDFLQTAKERLLADANLEKEYKESRFNASLSASFGLNQQAAMLPEVYKNPLNQEMFLVSLRIPIIDWGKAKGQREMAKMNREVVYIDAKQKEINLEQKILLNVMNFNLQKKLVQSSKKAESIAQQSYSLTQKSFLLGQASVVDLNSAKTQCQTAEEKYIESVYSYWKYYYLIQKATLYDFLNNKKIEVDFENLNK
jgi:outer membrane protein TolC